MFLAQAMNADRSCQKAVDDSAIKKVVGSLLVCSPGRCNGLLPVSIGVEMRHDESGTFHQKVGGDENEDYNNWLGYRKKRFSSSKM